MMNGKRDNKRRRREAGMAKNDNSSLGRAKKHKKDEFYTRLEDIECGGKLMRLYDRIVIRRRK